MRFVRPLHRYVGVPLTLLVLLSSVTGVLLAWKKNVALLQPPTQTGATTDLAEWRGFDEVSRAAVAALAAHLPADQLRGVAVDRMDARPDKGIVKVRFDNFWEVQVDPVTLETRSVARRNDEWIETFHDLSVVGDLFKVISMNLLGLGLILLSASGIWLWYGPRWIRRHKHPHS